MDMWRLLSLVAEKVEAKSAYPQHGWHKEVYSIGWEISSDHSARRTSWIVSFSELAGLVAPGAC